jgi:16S rRNA (guanine966-N2)-methyltransferase
MAKSKHTIRIISGSHGKRRLPVLNFAGLRPTGDRLRETLFNWLQFNIAGKSVLDLCAGTGALGFEAASRGAQKVVMVESNYEISKQLQKIVYDFEFEKVQVVNQRAQNYLHQTKAPVDLLFLDPPFDKQILSELTEMSLSLVVIGGFLYREFAKNQDLKILPDNWELYRHKTTSQVKIELWQRNK